MKLALLGGGGFRVPLVYRTLLRDRSEGRITQLRLHDEDPRRLAAMQKVLAAMADGDPEAPEVVLCETLEDAARSADFVFSAIRVGGTAGRARDEQIAHRLGVSEATVKTHVSRPPVSAASATRCAASPWPSTSPRGCATPTPTPG